MSERAPSDELAKIISKGVVIALRAAAERQGKRAAEGGVVAEGHENIVFSPEARVALSIAGDWAEIADDLEREVGS